MTEIDALVEQFSPTEEDLEKDFKTCKQQTEVEFNDDHGSGSIDHIAEIITEDIKQLSQKIYEGETDEFAEILIRGFE